MFGLALLIGIYSYGLFALGILGILTRSNITAFSLSLLPILIVWCLGKKPGNILSSIKNCFINLRLSRFSIIILSLLGLQLLVNLIGVFGPETGFDALWYHLGLPKIWLNSQSIDFLPGPVFRYSVMPKLTETIYAAFLSLSGLSATKLVHYLFGVLSLVVTFQLSRKFLSRDYALLAVLIMSSNLVFGWQSTSAYVDLARTFFEILALKLFIDKKYTHSAITLGLAVTSKLVALSSLPIFIILTLISRPPKKLKIIIGYIFYSFLIPLPWLLFSFLETGNWFYPLFSKVLEPAVFSFRVSDLWHLFVTNPDPITALYVISAPFVLSTKFTGKGRGVREIFIYAGIALLIWFITPRGGGSRFILPYLPAFSLITAYTISCIKDRFSKTFLITIALALSFTSIVYRLGANLKYVPVITGRESSAEFLSTRLNFSFGDYYDTDGFLKQTVSPGKKLLVVGINNLFYIPDGITFTHSSQLSGSDKSILDQFDYLLIRKQCEKIILPNNWLQIHTNPLTQTAIYRKN